MQADSWLLHISDTLAYHINISCAKPGGDPHNVIHISTDPFPSEPFHLVGTRDMSLSSKHVDCRVETLLCSTPSCMRSTYYGYDIDGGLILHSAELYSADIHHCENH